MSISINIGHIADCHLCGRQYGYESRGADFLNGAINAVDALRAKGVKLVLCSGDLLDTVNPGSNVCITHLNALRGRLAENGQLMLVIAGNHDNIVPHWCSEMLDSQADGGIRYIDGDVFRYSVPGADAELTVTGVRYCGSAAYASAMRGTIAAADVLMYHGDVTDVSPYVEEGTPSVRDFASTGKWNLVAAGHIHKKFYTAEDRPDGGRMVFAYPGSTELCSGAEDIGKSANMYTMVHGGLGWTVEDCEHVPFKTRPAQKFKLNTQEDLDAACRDVAPGAIVFVTFNRDLQAVHTTIKASADRKAHTDPSCTNKHTIFRMQPMLKKSEMEVLESIRGGKCISLVDYMKSVASDYISEEEADRGMGDLCLSMLNDKCDHRAALENYIMESLEGSVVL